MKCHKFEINLRKEVFREITRLQLELISEKRYLDSCYSHDERSSVNDNISRLTVQLELLNTLVANADARVS